MKKIVSLLLAVLMLISALPALAEDEIMIPGYYVPPKMTEGQYPIAEEGVTLTYWMPIAGSCIKFVPDHDGNEGHAIAQKETGVDIEFIHPAVGSEFDQFQLLLNSKKLPDMIQMPAESWYTGGLQAMYDDGIIIDLTPYLDELAPQYKVITEYNDLGYAQMHNDGKVLGFYKVTFADKIPYIRFNANKDWLVEAGMNEPKTIAEYEAYFDWILANKPGVVPVYWDLDSDQQANLTMGAYDFLFGWYLEREDGRTVNYWANSPEYKDWLTLMNSWYNKGYFHPDFQSLDFDEANAQFDAGKLACIANSVDTVEARVGGEFKVTNFPYMRKEADSVVGAGLASNPVGDGGDYITVITTQCDNVEAAIQYLNYGYTFEGSLPYSFGEYGTSWVWDENNMPVFTERCTNNPEMNNIEVCWVLHAHFATRYTYPDDITIPASGDTNSMLIRTLWADDKNEQNFLQMPPVTLSAEDSSERNDIMAQIDTYAEEKMMHFITGVEPLENFDAYLAELETMGMSRAIELTQAVTDEFFANAR